MTPSAEGPILTLEPLIEAVRKGVEGAGWELSGLQKTTSHQFEGRWDGESTRSAYVFFHAPTGPDFVSIDVYLDETSRGLTGNIALVVDLLPLGALGDGEEALRELSRLSSSAISRGHRRPITLRFRLEDAGDEPADAETEVRFKVRIPEATISAGPAAVRVHSAGAVAAFAEILTSGGLDRFTDNA